MEADFNKTMVQALEQELETLQQTEKSTKELLSRTQHELEDKQLALQKLQSAIEDSKITADLNKELLDKCKTILNAKEEKVSALTSQLQQCREQMKQHEEYISSLQRTIGEQANEIAHGMFKMPALDLSGLADPQNIRDVDVLTQEKEVLMSKLDVLEDNDVSHQHKIKSLMEQLSELREQLANTETDADNKKRQLTALEKRYKRLYEAKDDADESIDFSEATNRDLQHRIANPERDDAFRDTVLTLAQTCNWRYHQRAGLEDADDVPTKVDDISILENKLGELLHPENGKYMLAQKLIKKQEQELQKRLAQIEKLSGNGHVDDDWADKVDQLTSEKNDLAAKNDELTEQCERLASKNTSLHTRIKTDHGKLLQQLESLKAENKKLKDENASILTHSVVADKEANEYITRLNGQLNSLTSENEELKGEIALLRAHSSEADEKAREDSTSLAGQLHSATSENTRLKSENASLRSRIDVLEKNANEQYNRFDKQLHDVSSENAQLKQENVSLRTYNKTVNERIIEHGKLVDQYNAIVSENEALKAGNAILLNKSETAARTAAEQGLEILRLKNKVEEATMAYNTVNVYREEEVDKALERQSVALATLEKQLADTERKYGEQTELSQQRFETERQQLQTQLDNSVLAVDALKKALIEEQVASKHREQKNTDLKNQLLANKVASDKQIDDIRSQHQSEIKEIQKQHQAKLKETEKKLQAEIKSLKKELENVRRKLDHLTQTNQKLEDKCSEKNSTIAKLERDMKQLVKDHEEAFDKKFKDRLRKSERECQAHMDAKFNKKCEEKDVSYCKKLSKEEQRLRNEATQQLDEKRAALRDEFNARYADQISALQSQLSERAYQIRKLESKFTKADKEATEARTKIEVRDQTIISLKRQVHQCNVELKSRNIAVIELENETYDDVELIRTLRAEIEEKEKEIDEMKSILRAG